LLHLCIMQPQW